ncbi:M81 family metallopeptidase (plasmid) [Mesorhizobium sp. AR10]|uniref:M81 family metallopeptidase n=1 Tax=Mesorhizobium sp. AR10 TaxID=2865839 RepID=UPI0021610A63|nr:M81 family metallopeptidase [Mesorhizobium sp. AR10]UVK35920.1 M81 family metallopeptidase [Mesorhizobium sp. AR10]
MRIALGGILHETNTFRNEDAQLSDFHIVRGQALVATHQGVRSYIGGMLDAAKTVGATVLPTMFASAEAGGIISECAYSSMVDDLLAEIREVLPLDAVGLALHGAGIAHGIGNIEVDICRRVRDLVGSDVKIVITLDLHGNLDTKLSDVVDAAFGTNCHPHTDMFERGQDAITILPQISSGSISPVIYIEKIPLLLVTATTMYGPMAAVNQLCRSIEEDPDIIACTFFHGFVWTDTPDTGPSVLVIANGDARKAKDAARRIAHFVWNNRDQFRPNALSPEKAIESALRSEEWPVAVLDGGDDPGGGCPGDGTYLLRAMLKANLSDACFAAMFDPSIVAQAHSAGVGATIAVALGGKTDPRHGEPIAATAYIKALTDGRFLCQSPMGEGSQVSVGRTARLHIGGIDVVVVSERHQPIDTEIFLIHGIDVTRYRIIALKCTNHWRAGFAKVVKRDYLADSPGIMSRDLANHSYKHVARPIWPLDQEVVY